MSGGEANGHYLVYRGITREGHKVAVIWRETEDWTQEDYRRDKQFVADQNLAEGVDEIYVNGDSLIPSARALEGLFKARMVAEVEPGEAHSFLQSSPDYLHFVIHTSGLSGKRARAEKSVVERVRLGL